MAHESNVYDCWYHPGITLECTDCDEMFASHSQYRIHMRDIHNRLKPYRCYECHEEYAWWSALYLHMQKMHNHKERRAQTEVRSRGQQTIDRLDEKRKELHIWRACSASWVSLKNALPSLRSSQKYNKRGAINFTKFGGLDPVKNTIKVDAQSFMICRCHMIC